MTPMWFCRARVLLKISMNIHKPQPFSSLSPASWILTFLEFPHIDRIQVNYLQNGTYLKPKGTATTCYTYAKCLESVFFLKILQYSRDPAKKHKKGKKESFSKSSHTFQCNSTLNIFYIYIYMFATHVPPFKDEHPGTLTWNPAKMPVKVDIKLESPEKKWSWSLVKGIFLEILKPKNLGLEDWKILFVSMMCTFQATANCSSNRKVCVFFL